MYGCARGPTTSGHASQRSGQRRLASPWRMARARRVRYGTAAAVGLRASADRVAVARPTAARSASRPGAASRRRMDRVCTRRHDHCALDCRPGAGCEDGNDRDRRDCGPYRRRRADRLGRHAVASLSAKPRLQLALWARQSAAAAAGVQPADRSAGLRPDGAAAVDDGARRSHAQLARKPAGGRAQHLPDHRHQAARAA